jgi:hypothetical protein
MRASIKSRLKATALLVTLSLVRGNSVAQSATAKAVGTVKSISGNALVVTPDTGSEISVTFADSARILRTSPGQMDLKTATPISAADVHAGDRVALRGQASDNGTIVASSIIVMAKSDIAQRQQQERDEWRKGVGGIVKSVDAKAGTLALANAMLASGKAILVHVTAETKILRYAPDSVKFDDAKPGTLDQIKPGDQLRARGTKNADGTEFTAQAIVSGTFRDIAGTVISTDAANSSISIMDLASKKPLTVKINSESQLHKLPPFVAQIIAFRLKGGMPDGQVAQGAPQGQTGGQSGQNASQGQAGGPGGGQGNWAGRGQGNWGGQGGATGTGSGAQGGGPGGNWRNNGGGPPDFQQMLSRMPAVTIADLNKGDAVMLVATEGTSTGGPTAITMLAGVEPILSAAPPGMNAVMLLTPWNLGTGGAAGGGDMSTQ